MPALEPLPPVDLRHVELVTARLALARPVATSRGVRSGRDVLLVHVVADQAEGWAECVAEPEPTYGPEFAAGAALVLADHLIPRIPSARADATSSLGPALDGVRGHRMARAALELAVLDAQLRAAGRSLAGWIGATAATVPAGATVGMADDLDALVAEVAEVVRLGAARVRCKVAPGRTAALAAIRAAHPALVLQADANGGFDPADEAHRAELRALDELGLACLEQPFGPDDLVAHGALARELATPLCLDESITSPGTLASALALGACRVLCLKPGRVGGWVAARRLHDRAVEAGLGVWVGGMFETGLGRAANLAVAALPGITAPGDFDPRGWFAPDLVGRPADADDPVGSPDPVGLVVPTGPGTGVVPDPAVLADATIGRVAAWPA
ncbi:MAG: o-succinylbenzoate synthase [Acidimicrobiia bacterium]